MRSSSCRVGTAGPNFYALTPEGYVDHEGRGVAYDTFGRYFPGYPDPEENAEEALPELLEYERLRLESAPPEVEEALAAAVAALETFLVQLEAADWDVNTLDYTVDGALANDPAWEELASFEGVYCGTTSGLG